MHDLYRMLEVAPGADFETIRESYRRLLKRYHPDSGGSQADPEKLERVVEAFRRLREGREDRAAFRTRMTQRRRTGSRPEGARPDSGDLLGLGRTLTTSESVSARTFAARSLGNLGNRSAYTYLKRGLQDPDSRVVISCLRSIGRLNILQSADALLAVFHRSSPEVRRAVMQSVAGMSRLQLFRKVIAAGLEDADAAVRQRSLRLHVKLERQG